MNQEIKVQGPRFAFHSLALPVLLDLLRMSELLLECYPFFYLMWDIETCSEFETGCCYILRTKLLLMGAHP